MEYRHEIIEFPDSLPLKIFIHRIGDVGMHWHQSLELLYIVSGNVEITVGKDVFRLSDDDMLLVNSNMPHSLFSEDAMMIATQIKPERLMNIPEKLKYCLFDCVCSAQSDENREKFAGIKSCLASLLKLNIEGGAHVSLMNTSLCYKLMYELYVNFSKQGGGAQSDQREMFARITELLAYINEHYSENLSLEKLASVCYVTVPYLSKMFKNAMNITLSEYIKGIRLHHAAVMLLGSPHSIDEVSYECGFPNVHSFIAAFKEKYGATPGHWRKENKPRNTILKHNSSGIDKEKSIGYYSINSPILYSQVSDFIKKYSESHSFTADSATETAETEKIFIPRDGEIKLRHTVRMFIGVSRARELLSEEIQRELKEAQREIGFRFVKVHSILDDDMMVYDDAGGGPSYNFALIDKAFDFLLSIGLKPYMQLSFMPSKLARDKNKTTFYCGLITSMPSDMAIWEDLIYRLTMHLADRYGREEIESWPFAVWNEPATSEQLFGLGENDYYALYEHSYRAIKRADNAIKVGGPSHFAAYGKSDDFLFRFIAWANTAGCAPDFLDVHYYDIDMRQPYLDENGVKRYTPLSPRAGTFGEFLHALKERLHRDGAHMPLYITEWNSTTSHRDMLSDTCFKSAYIAKNLLENYDETDGMCYWLLSDMHYESRLNKKTFHGGLGLFTYNGIKKPSYFAYKFLSALGNKLLCRGDGYFATKRGDEYRIILYNYCHYSRAYSEDVGINTTYTDRYSVFPDKKEISFELELEESEGKYRVSQQILGRESGSAFDDFVKSGACEPISADDAEYLRGHSMPQTSGCFCLSPVKINVTLKPLEVRLIKIIPSRSDD